VGGLGRASAKLLLFGEHAAVYGHAAIGVSLPESTTVRLSDDAGTGWDLGALPLDDRDRVLSLLERLAARLPEMAGRGSCRVEIDSTVQRGVGFGSSAALCGAFARAALAHAGLDPAREAERAWRLAHDAEHIFHGTPSGIDTGLSLAAGMFAFMPRPPGLPAREALSGGPLPLVVAAVPRAEGCGALVGAIGERVRSGERAACRAIDALGDCAARARVALGGGAGGRGERVASLADEAMETLGLLGLSTPGLEELLAAGRAAGALGGKLSGAGGGGAFFLVARDEAGAHALAARVRGHAEAAAIPLVSAPRVILA
jgi:mevalonate kinase